MPKKFTVKNVKQFMRGYNIQHLHTVQQILEWFGLEPKLERIIWATIKRVELDSMATAEQARISGEIPPPRNIEAGGSTPIVSKEIPEEQSPLTTVVGKCPKCDSNLLGQPLGSCGKKQKQPTFYKECSACTYYAEIWRYGNKYKEVEGG